MAHTFTITVTDNQFTAMQLAVGDPDAFWQNDITEFGKRTVKQQVAIEVERLTDLDLPIPQTKGAILDSALAHKTGI